MENGSANVVESSLSERLGTQNAERAARVADAILPFVPVASAVKDVFEATTGHNVVTGEKLSNLERGIAAFGVLTLGAGSAVLEGTETMARASKEIEEGKSLEQLAARTESHAITESQRLLPGPRLGDQKLLTWERADQRLLSGPSPEERKLLTWEGAERPLLPQILQTTNGEIRAAPGVTTTLLGNYTPDMKKVLDELKYPETWNFGAKSGGFNALNIPKADFEALMAKGPDEFWQVANKPFLDEAIARGDRFILGTKPSSTARGFENFVVKGPSGPVTINSSYMRDMGREIKYLIEHGYVYDALTHEMQRLW